MLCVFGLVTIRFEIFVVMRIMAAKARDRNTFDGWLFEEVTELNGLSRLRIAGDDRAVLVGAVKQS
jgi:hypothetical protein